MSTNNINIDNNTGVAAGVIKGDVIINPPSNNPTPKYLTNPLSDNFLIIGRDKDYSGKIGMRLRNIL